MAVRTISTAIKLEGEQEFKRQMGLVNSELKNLKSEMSLVTAEFSGQANTVDALSAKNRVLRQQYDQQEEKVKALEKAVREASETYGDADKFSISSFIRLPTLEKCEHKNNFINILLYKYQFIFFFLKMGNPDWDCPYILKIMRFLRLCTVSSTIWCKFGVFVYFQSFFTNEVHPVL